MIEEKTNLNKGETFINNVNEFNHKKEALKNLLNKSAENVKKPTRKTKTKEFLNSISDLLIDSTNKGVSARQLSKDIYTIYNFKISDQTIRMFITNLNIEK